MKKRQKLLTDEQWELIEPLLAQPKQMMSPALARYQG
jgi:hypothetical protein